MTSDDDPASFWEKSVRAKTELLLRNPENEKVALELAICQKEAAEGYDCREGPANSQRALFFFEAAVKTLSDLYSRNPNSDKVSKSLAISQNDLGNFLFRTSPPGDYGRALSCYESAVRTCQEAYQKNSVSLEVTERLLDQLDSISLFFALRGNTGDIDLQIGYREESVGIAKSLHRHAPESEEASQMLVDALGELASVLVFRSEPGDIEKALHHHEHALEINEELQRRNPKSKRAKGSVGFSLRSIGDLYRHRNQDGDAIWAKRFYESSLQVFKDLYVADPSNYRTARSVSTSLAKLGGILKYGEISDIGQALSCFEEAKDINADLCRQDRENKHATRAFAISYDRLGLTYLLRDEPGDSEKATECFEAELRLFEDLYQRAHNRKDQRSLSIAQERLGDSSLRRGDAVEALRFFKASLKNREELQNQEPENFRHKCGVSISYERLGDCYLQLNKSNAAEQAHWNYQKALQIIQDLQESEPERKIFQSERALLEDKIREIQLRLGNL